MAKRHSSQPSTGRRLRVGDRVSFHFGDRRVVGIVVEDRGAIGADGARLFAVRAKLGGSEPSIIELPAEDLRAA